MLCVSHHSARLTIPPSPDAYHSAAWAVNYLDRVGGAPGECERVQIRDTGIRQAEDEGRCLDASNIMIEHKILL